MSASKCQYINLWVKWLELLHEHWKPLQTSQCDGYGWQILASYVLLHVKEENVCAFVCVDGNMPQIKPYNVRKGKGRSWGNVLPSFYSYLGFCGMSVKHTLAVSHLSFPFWCRRGKKLYNGSSWERPSFSQCFLSLSSLFLFSLFLNLSPLSFF